MMRLSALWRDGAFACVCVDGELSSASSAAFRECVSFLFWCLVHAPSIPHVFSVIFVMCHCACACVRIKKRLIPLVSKSWWEMDVCKWIFVYPFSFRRVGASVNFSIHFSYFILPSTRLRNLLWYVCSRGPLRLIFLTALLLLPFPSTFDLHIECCITASCRPRCLVVGLPAWHPDEYAAVTLTVECVRCVVKGRKELQVCGYDRTGNMFGHVSLIRHSHRPPPHQTHRPLFWMYRKTQPVAVAGGGRRGKCS